MASLRTRLLITPEGLPAILLLFQSRFLGKAAYYSEFYAAEKSLAKIQLDIFLARLRSNFACGEIDSPLLYQLSYRGAEIIYKERDCFVVLRQAQDSSQ
jgi:hypothetical protein